MTNSVNFSYFQDTEGESILICANGQARIGQELIGATLKPITSCLATDSHVSGSIPFEFV